MNIEMKKAPDFIEAFRTKTHCDRCGRKLTKLVMSKMNTDALCKKCIAEEKEHPRYREAIEADKAEIEKGNINYLGLFAGQKWPFELF